MFLFWCIFPSISSQPEGALPGTLWNVGVGAAPAGGGGRLLSRTREVTGFPPGPIGGLPLKMAGRGTGERCEITVLRLRPPSPRKRGPGPKDRRGGASGDVSAASGFLSRESCCLSN